MPEILPTFLVAGAARSGTTGLVEGLRTHPDVFVTQPKEPHYFALHGTRPDFQAPSDEATINKVSVTDRAAYLDLYADAGSKLCRGDGSVSTLYYHQQSIPEIAKINPDIRVVIMLREPVDRAFSSYQYLRARGFETEESFSAAVAAEPSRRAQNWHHLWHYTQMSLYAESVSAFLDGHGRDKVGIWFYDELQADYEGTVSQVLRFLGAPPAVDEAAGVPRVNVSGSPRSRVALRAMHAAARNDTLRRVVKRTVSFRTREMVRRLALKPEGADRAAREAMEPLFTADLAALAPLLGNHPRPLPAWLASAAR